MLDERFRSLKATRTPDLWPDIEHREPRPPRPEIPWGRFGTAAVAFAVAAAGIAFAARAFLGEPPRMQSEPTEPAVGNGLITFSDGGDAYVVEENGSGLRNLTRTTQGEALYPWEWSPDGQRLALYGYVDDPNLTGANYDIYVLEADGSSLHNLTTDVSDVELAASQGDPAWSPDGRMLAYTDDGGHQEVSTNVIQVVGVDGKGRRTITDPSSPAFTPDMSRHGVQAYAPDWSPDGTRIVFARYLRGGSEIYSVALDGESLHRLADGDSWNGEPAWSPDGSRVAFTSDRTGSSEIYVMESDGSDEQPLTELAAKNLGGPEWSPDGEKIIFEVYDEDDWDIWIVNADGSGARPLTHGSGDETSPEWAPDGSRIAYLDSPVPSGERDNAGTFDVYVMNFDGTDQKRLTQDAGALGGGLSWQAVPTSSTRRRTQRAVNQGGTCPIEAAYAIANSEQGPQGVRLVLEERTPVVSAMGGAVRRVVTEASSGWAGVTVSSSDLELTYRFYADAAGGHLPVEGAEIRSGDVIGGANELLDLKAEAIGDSPAPDLRTLLEDWGCREGLTPTDVLRARLLDGSAWEVQLAESIEVAGAHEPGAYGELMIDGEVVADATRLTQRPELSRPFANGFDPPILLDEFSLSDGRRAEHWDLAPSHENDTYAYALWVEGPREHMYFSSSQPIPEVELVSRSLRMAESDGRIEGIWFDSDRIDVANLQAVFFLKDPQAPERDLDVRLNAACRVGQDLAADCDGVKLEVPVYTPGTEQALRGASVRRLEP